MSKNQTVVVKIMDKDYQIACPEGQQEALVSSARYLDQKMREIRKSGKVLGLERIAVMAALNISNELIQSRGEEPITSHQQLEQVNKINSKLEDAIQKFRQLEI